MESVTEITKKIKISKNINLLPPELRFSLLKRLILYQDSHPRQFLLYSSAALLLVIASLSIGQAAATRKYIRKTAQMQDELYKLQAKSKELAGIKAQIDQEKENLNFRILLLNKRLAFLNAQYNYGHNWVNLLSELKRIKPEGTWLIGLKTEDYYLKINGGALSEALVSELMADLRKSPLFSNVSFNYAQKSKIGKTPVVIFEVTTNYIIDERQAQNKSPKP